MIASSSQEDAANNATDAQRASASEQAQLGRDQLAFNIRQYDEAKPMRDQVVAQQLDLAKSQQNAMDTQTGIAKDYDQYNKSTFRPVEQALVSDAQGYDTAQRRSSAAEGAAADVTRAFQDASEGLRANLGRGGIATGAGRAQSLQNDNAIAEAAAASGASRAAVNRVEDIGHARMIDAASLGRNLPANQATAASTAINAGQAASAAGQAALASGQSGIPNVNSGYSGAIGAIGGSGSLYGGAARGYAGLADASAGAIGSFGSAAGRFATTPYGTSMVDSARNWYNGMQSGRSQGVYLGQDASYDGP